MVIRVYNVNEGGVNETTVSVKKKYYANSDNERPAPLYTDARGV